MKNAALCACVLATAVVLCLLTPLLLGGCGEPTVTPVLRTAGVWPSWTPLPSNTPRVYPTWTPEPTNTPRVYPTWTPEASMTATQTQIPTWTATPTAHVTPEMPPVYATPTLPSCSGFWPFTFSERMNIQAAALNLLWGLLREPVVLPNEDPILGLGLYMHRLGCPVTDEYTILADDGRTRIRCRGFALGIVALMERADIKPECVDYAVLGWDGEPWE